MTITVTGGDGPVPSGPDGEPRAVRTVRGFLRRHRRPLIPLLLGLLIVVLAAAVVTARRPVPTGTAVAPPVTSPSPTPPDLLALSGRAADQAVRQTGTEEDEIVVQRAFPLDGDDVPSTDPLADGNYLIHLSCVGRGRVEVQVLSFGVEPDGGPDLDAERTVGEASPTCYEQPSVLALSLTLAEEAYVRVVVTPDDRALGRAGFAFLVALGPQPR